MKKKEIHKLYNRTKRTLKTFGHTYFAVNEVDI
jgi:hypothetical protein